MIAQPTTCRADRAIEYIQTLSQSRGPNARDPLELREWQQQWVRGIFDPRIRRVGAWIPRKNGKSAFACSLAVYVFACENPPMGEVILAAPTIKQAGRQFQTAVAMLQGRYPDDAPRMGQRGVHNLRFSINHGSKEITDKDSGAKLFVLSGDGAGHGYGPSLVICDELHEWRRGSELWTALQTGFGDQTDGYAKLVTITTSGVHDPEHLEQQEYEYAEGVRDGRIDDPTYLPIIYAAPKDAAWDDETAWRGCNPALGDFLSLDFLRSECARARNQPRKQNVFRRLYLNQRTAAVDRWLNFDHWTACKGVAEIPADADVFGGLDLASKQDIAALVFIAKVDGKWTIEPHFWIPSDTAQEHQDECGIQYKEWEAAGYITFHDGPRIVQTELVAEVVELCKARGCRHVGLDDWNAAYAGEVLSESGIEVVELSQSAKTYDGPCKEFEAALSAGQVEHPGNKVLDWMAGNVETKDVGDRIRPVKPKTALKIDGITALLMALSEAMSETPAQTWWAF